MARIFSGNEDTWLCENGQWIRHGNPSGSEPTSGCGITPKPEEGLIIDYPKENALISSPLMISGTITGNKWTGFEGQAGVVNLIDENGNILSASVLVIKGEWTQLPADFEANLEFEAPESGDGWLIFYNENPSGLDGNSVQFAMPIKFNHDNLSVEVYFGNSEKGSDSDCSQVFAVDRVIAKTEAVARAAIEELLKGPSQSEVDGGFFTTINSGVKIQKLVIENKVAKIDFSSELDENIGGSCRVTAIKSQIIQTLKQFSTISDVVISIDGRIEDILQP